MKKTLLFFYLTFCMLHFSLTQNLLVKQWDYRFGGTNDENLYYFQQTNDGGYILGGASNSDSSGDRTQQSRGNFDYWIVKTDSIGNKQWDKRFGGADVDYLFCIQESYDGGYVLGGSTYSYLSGDISQAAHGLADYWIVKIDSVGNKLWDKRFGGTKDDWLYSLKQTTDGGYILGGQTNSGISGDVSQPNWD
jgi:hypothetical protein